MNLYDKTFIGCDSGFDESGLVLFGAPFDGTSSYRPGSRFAASAMRAAAYSIETYSPYLDRDLTELKICDLGDLELPFGSAEKTLAAIEDCAGRILDAYKLPVMIGGEHLVTLGAVRAAAKRFPELRIVHFDAHTDLRQEYLGEALSHATVMRRCWDILGDGRIFQFGIRSGDKAEFEWAREHVYLRKYHLFGTEELERDIGNAPVYFSLDIDVLDPSECPGTGTPEAGGVSFAELLNAFDNISGLNIVGADLNELSPPYDPSGISVSLGCKLLREMLLTISDAP